MLPGGKSVARDLVLQENRLHILVSQGNLATVLMPYPWFILTFITQFVSAPSGQSIPSNRKRDFSQVVQRLCFVARYSRYIIL